MTTPSALQVGRPTLRFSTSVRALKAAQRVTTEELCRTLLMSKATFFNRLADGSWSLAEALKLAELFDVPLQVMLDGIGVKSVDGGTTRRYLRPYLAASTPKAVRTTPRSPLLAVVQDLTPAGAGPLIAQ